MYNQKKYFTIQKKLTSEKIGSWKLIGRFNYGA
jgi:hypothetical protein